MKNCFLLSFNTEVNIKEKGGQLQNFLVLFFPYKNIKNSQSNIQLQLRDHFFRNTLPDKLVIIGFEFNETELLDLFRFQSGIYDYIPKFQCEEDGDNIAVLIINKRGTIKESIGKKPYPDVVGDIYRRGMVNIFNNNGGLIVSQSAHHYVFPSGKHCDRFLRTGNVLVNGTEILFIASAIILHFKGKYFQNIYCDTSSINSLAYSYISLMRDLNKSFSTVHVESFGSYELFEKFKFKAERNSLFLISSSTSGSILKRMTSRQNKKQNIDLKNIAIIYGLNVESEYKAQVICDLTRDNMKNPMGLPPFKSFNINKGENCILCEEGSVSVKVEGDVFLLEKPVVTGHRITIHDAPSFLRYFGDYYRKKTDDRSVIRTFYKENSTRDKKYDIYIDVEYIFDQWLADRSVKIKGVYDKLEKYISQHIPATLKYMVVLPDVASSKLAKVISKVLENNGITFNKENILNIENLKEIDKSGNGVIAVVSSSIVSGRNLLYLSRALRDFEQNYQRMFFTFLQRAERKEHCNFLESNLGMGEFGKESNKIINVETIFCSQESLKTPWHVELEFLKKLQEFCDVNGAYEKTSDFCIKRIQELNDSGVDKGLVNNLFFPNLHAGVLKINNGFAFAPPQNSKYFAQTSTQSEVYFIVSSVLNEIRSKGKLVQSEYVRNLIEPGNFVRYNDGIIQACLLRAAKPSELQYNLSHEMSLQMQAILGDMIIHIEDNHAEAINEFLYAIAIQKLKLSSNVLSECIELLELKCAVYGESVTEGLVGYIKENIVVKNRLHDTFEGVLTKLEEMKR